MQYAICITQYYGHMIYDPTCAGDDAIYGLRNQPYFALGFLSYSYWVFKIEGLR